MYKRQILLRRMVAFSMTIALIAHDSKKELMVQFCMAYRHILEPVSYTHLDVYKRHGRWAARTPGGTAHAVPECRIAAGAGAIAGAARRARTQQHRDCLLYTSLRNR